MRGAPLSRQPTHPMRIAAFSDTHGNKDDMRDAVRRFGPLDLLVHLGDGIREGRQAAEAAGIPFCGVRGNNDHGGPLLPDQTAIDVQGWQFLLTHGHETGMNPYNPEPAWQTYLREMAARAKDLGAHALLFGHAHKPVLQRENGVVLCNPGDQYIGATTGASFALVVLEDGTADFRIFRKNGPGVWDPLMELRPARA